MVERKRKKCSDISDPRTLIKGETPKVDSNFRVHCPSCVKQSLKVFMAQNDFDNYWSAILYLLNHYKEEIPKTGSHVITAERFKQQF